VQSLTYKLVATCATLISLGACASLLDIPDEPVVIPDGPWSCLGKPAKASAVSSATQPETATVRVHACNFVSTNCASAVTDLTATLCDKRDVNCIAPIQVGIRDTVGDLSFQVPTGGPLGTGFDGYLKVTAPSALCTNQALFGADQTACLLAPTCDPLLPDDKCKIPVFTPGLLFFNPGIKADVREPINLSLIPTTATFSLLQAAGSRSADPNTGFVFVTALDCDGKPASGATLGISPLPPMPVGTLYLANGIVSASAVETDASGIGGILGVPTGFVRVSARAPHAIDNPEIGSVGVQVAPSSVTYVTVAPGQ
jgi:hypothetical protein